MNTETCQIEFTRKQALQFVTELYSTYAALRVAVPVAQRENLSSTERVADILAKWLIES